MPKYIREYLVPNAALYVVSFADPAEPCAVKRMLNDNILICLPHTSEALCSLRATWSAKLTLLRYTPSRTLIRKQKIFYSN